MDSAGVRLHGTAMDSAGIRLHGTAMDSAGVRLHGIAMGSAGVRLHGTAMDSTGVRLYGTAMGSTGVRLHGIAMGSAGVRLHGTVMEAAGMIISNTDTNGGLVCIKVEREPVGLCRTCVSSGKEQKGDRCGDYATVSTASVSDSVCFHSETLSSYSDVLRRLGERLRILPVWVGKSELR